MMKAILIPGTSLRVSEMALGAMPWGTRIDVDGALRLYDLFRAEGGNTFDTAHIYAAWEKNGAGASEKALGEVLRQSGERRQLVIISKGGHPAESFYRRPDRFLSPEVIASDIKESLERLGLGMIDLYFVHRDDSRVPVGEVIDALNGEVSAGRIRYFGASNWKVQRIAEANAWASDKGVMGFVASQPEFSLAEVNGEMPATDPALRWLTDSDVAWHERTGLPAFCYSPTAQGYFAKGGGGNLKRFENMVSRGRLRRAQELAHTLGWTVNQVALGYVMAQRFPAIPILGTADAAHLKDALEGAGGVGGAAGRRLTVQQAEWLKTGN